MVRHGDRTSWVMPTDTLDAGLLHTGRPDRSPPEGADIAPLENEPFADAVVRLGHSGPRWWPGGSKGWDGCYALGMIGGAVIGVWGLPSIDPVSLPSTTPRERLPRELRGLLVTPRCSLGLFRRRWPSQVGGWVCLISAA